MTAQRRYPIGAEVMRGGTHFRVWAPDCRDIEVVIGDEAGHRLFEEDTGYFSGLVPKVGPEALYSFVVNGKSLIPDPASRFQPTGPHGPSQVVDPKQFAWTDDAWRGLPLEQLIIYELHIGTFTPEGTWAAAARELPELAEVGINCVELMPVADFAGEFGWGYDGVNLFAPTRLYGQPDDFRRFVDAAHSYGITVLLDVVYNHFGPDGNYVGQFCGSYFTDHYKTDWGSAINFDGQQSGPVREFYLTNVAHWIEEYHLDGLRLDATQNIYDKSPPAQHILTQITQRARAAAPHRTIIVVAENEPQDSQLIVPVADGGYGLDAVWNDDLHHTARVALTGQREAYYTDYRGTPQEFISAAKHGYLYQGQWYSWQKQGRGRPGLDLGIRHYVNYLQNHDQVANSARGQRAHQLCSPARYRALTALTLLMPGTPMLFMGQEFAASSPFLYFADHGEELAGLVQAGRAEFLSQFPSIAGPQMQAELPLPHQPQTFHRCKLDFAERLSHAADYLLTKDLLRLRRTQPAFQSTSDQGIDGAVLDTNAFVLRYFHQLGDCLLIVNLGPDLNMQVVPEPLLAPEHAKKWALSLSTEDPQYGGNGICELNLQQGDWRIPAETAVIYIGKHLTA